MVLSETDLTACSSHRNQTLNNLLNQSCKTKQQTFLVTCDRQKERTIVGGENTLNGTQVFQLCSLTLVKKFLLEKKNNTSLFHVILTALLYLDLMAEKWQ